MKIAFIGNFEAEFSTENYHKKTFEKLGHEVLTFQENKCRVSDLPVSGIDMLFWTHTHGWRIGSNEEIKKTLARYKDSGIPTVGYHLDLWLGLEREKDLHTDPYWNIQHFFTVDKLMADWLNANTATKGYFLPAGVYEDDCFIGTPDRDKYPHDIIFTGAKDYHNEWPYRPKLINWLHKTYGKRFGHYGRGGLPQVRGRELNNLYASAKIVIGDTLCKNFTYPWYSSDRLFEVTGRGGFLIYPLIEGLTDLFNMDEVCYYDFYDFDFLKRTIHWYLNNDSNREQYRMNGLYRAKSEHTYTHRLQTILKTIFP